MPLKTKMDHAIYPPERNGKERLMEAKSMKEILKALEGQIVSVVNPQSYVRTLTGYSLDVETYNAKVVSFENDTLKLLTEYLHDPRTKTKAKGFQFIHIDNVKRVGVSKTEKFIFL